MSAVGNHRCRWVGTFLRIVRPKICRVEKGFPVIKPFEKRIGYAFCASTLLLCGLAVCARAQPAEVNAMSGKDRHVLSEVNQIVKFGPFQLVNNVWNTDGLVSGKNFWQRISYDVVAFHSAHHGILKDIDFSWWYAGNGDAGVRAYPEVIVGQSPWDGEPSSDFASRIGDLKTFDVTFEVHTPTGHAAPGSNIAFDIWLTKGPARGPEAITTEVMIWLSSRGMGGADEKTGRFYFDGLKGHISVREDFTAGTAGGTWRYIALFLDEDYLKGSLDLNTILQALIARGLVSEDDWVTGYELGAEVVSGSGRMTLDRLTTNFRKN